MHSYNILGRRKSILMICPLWFIILKEILHKEFWYQALTCVMHNSLCIEDSLDYCPLDWMRDVHLLLVKRIHKYCLVSSFWSIIDPFTWSYHSFEKVACRCTFDSGDDFLLVGNVVCYMYLNLKLFAL